jgi:murein DD-endopeptidase MepM/ murein hydrolase activator NlpD
MTQLANILRDTEAAPVMGEALSFENAFEISLNSFKTELLHLQDRSKTSLLQQYMDEKRRVLDKKFALGGYLEDRSWYARSPLFGKERSIHLGIDIWAEAGSNVHAPLSGKIHSFRDNGGFGNYGPTIILEHELNDFKLFTLYGHLSRASVAQCLESKEVMQGELIGQLGDIAENGEWPAHLHFQIIIDLQGNKGDYPGVCSKEDVKFYQNNCLDPNLLLRFEKK